LKVPKTAKMISRYQKWSGLHITLSHNNKKIHPYGWLVVIFNPAF